MLGEFNTNTKGKEADETGSFKVEGDIQKCTINTGTGDGAVGSLSERLRKRG